MGSITIRQACEQGSLRLVFSCSRPDVRPAGALCGHRGEVSIEMALHHWGKDKSLDEIGAYCGRCGSRDFVNVSGEPPGRHGKRSNR